jgi:hypothetical protein
LTKPVRLELGAYLLAFSIVLAPVSAPAAEMTPLPAPDLKIGDSWVFDRSFERGASGYSKQRLDFVVERVAPERMVVGIKLDGSPAAFEDHIMGPDWSQRRITNGEQTTTGRPFAFPLTIGKTWTSDYVDPTRHGLQVSATHHDTYKVVGWEDVATPAGSFHALKIESDDKVEAKFLAANGAVGGVVTTSDGSTVVAHTEQAGPRTVFAEVFSALYYVPEVKYWVKTVREDFNSEGVRTGRQTDVLVSFKPAL